MRISAHEVGTRLGKLFAPEWLQKQSKAPMKAVSDAVNALYSGAQKIAANAKPTNPKDTVGVRKAPMSTVSQLVLAEVGVAMLEGALKYGRSNYRVKGVRGSVYYDAAMRHLRSWWEGEDIDQASQLSHITKAITSLIVLRDAMILEKFTDDRPPAVENPGKFFAELDAIAAALVDRDGHLNPVHYTNTNKED